MKGFFKKVISSLILSVMILSTAFTGTVQAASYKNGSRGTQVRYLQQNLSFLGYSLKKIDGIYGTDTTNAVIALQKALNLNTTGIVNDELDSLIRGTVKDIQTYLIKKGYLAGSADGIKGNATGKAFKAFQTAHGCKQTGIVDLQILKDILNDTSVNLELTSLKEWVNRLEPNTNANVENSTITNQNNTYNYISLSELNYINEQYKNHHHYLKQNYKYNTTAIVKALQILLNAEGGYYTLEENGVFDTATYKAVCSFQARYGLTVDGIVGNDTWNKLYSVISSRINSLENCHLNMNAMFDYAKLHWNNYNIAEYTSYKSSNSDCCNYVSQILSAGGLNETASWHGSKKYNDVTDSFDYIQTFTDYMCKTYNIEYRTNFSINDVEIGDCIISDGGTHIVFVIGVNQSTGQIFFTGHTNDRYYGLEGNDDNMSFYYVSMLQGVLKTSDIRLYTLYGDNYLPLFENKAYYLNNEKFSNYTKQLRTTAIDTINKSGKNSVISSYLYSLENGIETIAQSIFAKLGWGKNLQKEIRLNSIKFFMQELCKNENFINTLSKNTKQINSSSYLLTNIAEKAKFIEDLANTYDAIPYSSIEKIVNYMCNSSIGVAKCTENGISYTQFIAAHIQLAQIEVNAINEIQRLIDPSSDMYNDLNLLKEELSKNWLEHFNDYYFNDIVQNKICSSIKELIISSVSGEITEAVADIAIYILVNHLYKGELADDIAKNFLIYYYETTLDCAVKDKFTNLCNNNINSKPTTIKDIEEYETVFSAHLASLKIMLETANKINNSPILEMGIDSFKNGSLSYDNYIKDCFENTKK